MAESNNGMIAEEMVVNPSKVSQTVKNVSNMTGNESAYEAVTSKNPLFNKLAEGYFQSKAWQEYIQNPFRTFSSDNMPNYAIEQVSQNPLWSNTLDVNGQAIHDYVQNIHSVYGQSNNVFRRIKEGYQSARFGLRASNARTKLDEAILAGDEVEISRWKAIYEAERDNINKYGTHFEKYGNTLMQFNASIARNPETVAITVGSLLAAGAITGMTGGAAAPLVAWAGAAVGNVISSGIVGKDTYNLEHGAALEELDTMYPDMTEEEKHYYAKTIGLTNAALEVIPNLFSGGTVGRGLNYLRKATAKALVRSDTAKILEKNIISPAFIKALQKNVKKNSIGKFLGEQTEDAIINGLQEVIQNSVTDAGIEVAGSKDKTIAGVLGDEYYDFAKNPFNPRHADKWTTFIDTALVSPILGGTTALGGAAISNAPKLASLGKHSGLGDISDKQSGALNNERGLGLLFKWHKDATSKGIKADGLKAAQEVLQQGIKDGSFEGKLYISRESVEAALADPDVAIALEELGISKSMEEADLHGGHAEIDLIKYDNIVNENEILFQKIRNYITFSPTTMSTHDFSTFVNREVEGAKLITKDIIEDPNSFYNKILNTVTQANIVSDKLAKSYASLGQIIANQIGGFKEGNLEEFTNRFMLQINKVIQQSTNTPKTQTQTTEEVKPVIRQRINRKLTDSNWNKIRALFSEDKLKEIAYTRSSTGDEFTFEQLLKQTVINSLGYEKGFKFPQGTAKRTEEQFNIPSGLLARAITIARGDEYLEDDPNKIEATNNVPQLFDSMKKIKEPMSITTDNSGIKLYMFAGSSDFNRAEVLADRLGKTKEFEQAVSLVQEAKNKGVEPDAEAIYKATGWYYNPDGTLSYEIDDSNFDINWDNILGEDKSVDITRKTMTLSKFMNHTELFSVFPILKDMPITFSNNIGDRTLGFYSPRNKNIELNAKYFNNVKRSSEDFEGFEERVKDTLVHEVQHAIQHEYDMMYITRGFGYANAKNKKTTPAISKKRLELALSADELRTKLKERNFDFSGNIRDLYSKRGQVLELSKNDEELSKSLKKFLDLFEETKEYNVYDSSEPGEWNDYIRRIQEVQARNTENRRKMTEEQRRNLSPAATYDIAGYVKVGKLSDDIKQIPTIIVGTEPIIDTVELGNTKYSRDGEITVTLQQDANVVTFAHEMYHVFSLELQRLYNYKQLTDYWNKQAQKMFKAAGVKQEVLDGDLFITLTPAQEEHMANMFTTFLQKGKLENENARSMLSVFINAMRKVYRQLVGSSLKPIAVNEEAKQFFDTIFTTQDEVEKLQRMAGIYEIAKPDGVSAEVYDYYIDSLRTSQVKATQEIIKKYFKTMQFKQTTEYESMLQERISEHEQELSNDPRYLVYGLSINFSGADKAEKTLAAYNNSQHTEDLTLEDVKGYLETTDAHSLHNEAVSMATEDMDKYIQEKYNVDPSEYGFFELRNAAKIRSLIAEKVMLEGGDINKIEAEIRNVNAAADKYIAKLSVSQIVNINRWKDLEAAVIERFGFALEENRKDMAGSCRFDQAVLTAIMIRSKQYERDLDRCKSLFDKLKTRQKKYQRTKDGKPYGKYEHRYQAEDWELLRSMAEQFGLKVIDPRRDPDPVGVKLENWITKQEKNRFTLADQFRADITFINAGHEGNITSMKGKDFKRMWGIIHSIDLICAKEREVYLDGEYKSIDELIDMTNQYFAEKGLKSGDIADASSLSKAFGLYGNWTNPEAVLSNIFPKEVMRKIWLPMIDAAVTSEKISKDWIEEYRAAKSLINTSTKKAHKFSNGRALTYSQIADFMLSLGAEHAYENILLKLDLTKEEADLIASEALQDQPKLEQFMKTVWRVYGKSTELLNNEFVKRWNELFVRKEHRKFTINGIEFEGGYVPEDKDFVEAQSIDEFRNAHMGMNKSEKTMTKKADGNTRSILYMMESKLSQFAKWGYCAIPFDNCMKFVNDNRMKSVIGERAYEFINGWLKTWNTPHKDPTGIVRIFGNMSTVAALGLRASTAIMQLSGLVQIMPLLKANAKTSNHKAMYYLHKGIQKFFAENGYWKPASKAKVKSEYMSARIEDFFQSKFGTGTEFTNIISWAKNIEGGSKLSSIGKMAFAGYQKLAMSFIQYFDGCVSLITWNAAYEQAMDDGMEDLDARRYADSMVRQGQSDAMQISRSQALQDPLSRVLTPFATWIMAMQSQFKAMYSTGKKQQALFWAFSYIIVSSMIEALMKETTDYLIGSDDDDDKDFLEKINQSWYNRIIEAVGSTAIPAWGIGSQGLKYIAAEIEKSITDEDKTEWVEVYNQAGIPAITTALKIGKSAAEFIGFGADLVTGEYNPELLQKSGIDTVKAFNYELGKILSNIVED